MKVSDALAAAADYTADQWGMITSAQAAAAGIDSVTLYRLADAGHLEQVRRGVYAATTAPASRHRDVQAAWLSLNPSVPAWERPKLDPDGGVVSHRAAAALHNLGDMLVERIELTVPRRRSSRDPLVQLRQRELDDIDVSLVDGLPVTTPARTIEDLLVDHVDASHVAAVIKDGAQAGTLDLDVLGDRIGPYARRYGVKRRDGHRLIDYLLDQIGTTRSAVARLPARASDALTLSLFNPELREALNRISAMPALRQQLAGLAGIQAAALAGIADQLLKTRQAAFGGLADQIRAPQAALAALGTLQSPSSIAAAAALAAGLAQPSKTAAADRGEGQ